MGIAEAMIAWHNSLPTCPALLGQAKQLGLKLLQKHVRGNSLVLASGSEEAAPCHGQDKATFSKLALKIEGLEP